MLNKIPFVKMHGLGNDFVIMNHLDLPKNCNLSELAIAVSDRKLAIGCDQFIIYDYNSKFCKMMIYNMDGSFAEACGNGARCLAKLIYLTKNQKKLILKVRDRNLDCEILDDNNVKVNMGKVSFQENWMPSLDKIFSVTKLYMFEFKEVICVDMGNPHLVIFSNLSDIDKEILGKKFQEDNLFPLGVNVNFASIKDDRIFLSVWERGAGITLACASGACATFAAASKLGFVESSAEVIFQKGKLIMSSNNGAMTMSGPTQLVAKGEYYYEK